MLTILPVIASRWSTFSKNRNAFALCITKNTRYCVVMMTMTPSVESQIVNETLCIQFTKWKAMVIFLQLLLFSLSHAVKECVSTPCREVCVKYSIETVSFLSEGVLDHGPRQICYNRKAPTGSPCTAVMRPYAAASPQPFKHTPPVLVGDSFLNTSLHLLSRTQAPDRSCNMDSCELIQSYGCACFFNVMLFILVAELEEIGLMEQGTSCG